MESIFTKLVELPLFRGVTTNTMARVVGKTRFSFMKYLPANVIISAGNEIPGVLFLLGGSVRMETKSENGRLVISQHLAAPDVLVPDFVFGRDTTSPSTITAVTTANILQISKPDYLDILGMDHVFMLNYLNLLSLDAQKSQRALLHLTQGDLAKRLAYWVMLLTQQRATDVVLTITTRDLATLFGVQRSALQTTLEKMKAESLIDFTPNALIVPDRRALAELFY